jgi:hypothetical protein
MSVIAWNGEYIAADRRRENNYLSSDCCKLKIYGSLITGRVGDEDAGLILEKWYLDGADPEKWPACQRDKDRWARLIVVKANGACVEYQREPIAIEVYGPFHAWGTGAEVAVGAMAMGASPMRAVEVANKHSTGCGNGVIGFQCGGSESA